MKYLGLLELTPREWDIIRNLDNSLTMKEVALKSGIPYTTVSNTLRKLGEKCKVGFNPDYKKIGLIYYVVLFKGFSRQFLSLPYVYTVRRAENRKRVFGLLTALVPYKYLNEFKDVLQLEEEYSITTFHRIIWRPSKSRLMSYENGVLKPNFKSFDKVFEENKLVKEERFWKGVRVDKYDMFILSYKVKDLFTSLRELSRRTGGRVSHQVLSYHYRTHVLKLWDGNVVRFYVDVERFPIWVIVLSGENVKAFTRTLIEIPGFYVAFLGEKETLLWGQVPYLIKLQIYSLIREYDIEILYDLNITDKNLLYKLPFKYFKNNRWLSPREIVEAKTTGKILHNIS